VEHGDLITLVLPIESMSERTSKHH